MTRTPVLVPALVALATVGCVETTIHADPDQIPLGGDGAPACIQVTPRQLQFDAVDLTQEVIEPQSLQVQLANTCAGDLQLEALSLSGADVAAFDYTNLGQILLGEGESTTVDVTFMPRGANTFKARLLVDSNDPEKATEVVRLEGVGIAPEIEVSPERYDYGAPFIGCETETPIVIRNTGNADLTVSDIALFTASAEEFGLDTDPTTNGTLPFQLGPYDSVNNGPIIEVYLDYLALDTFSDTAFVSIASNDPAQVESVVDAAGVGTKFGENLDIFEQPIRSATDILFTLDRSGSMYDNNENVIENFDVFVATLASLDADYHAAVVVADSGCVVGPDGYIDNTFSESAAVAAFRTMADQDFSLSSYGANTERGYMLAEAALSSVNTGPGGCNADFYREDAFLSIVHVSDEPEQSVSSWSYYVALFQSLKSDPEDVKINAVAGDYPSGCSGASAGTGYYEGTVATGGLFLSICSDDWASSLEKLANESVSINDSFELTQQPVPQTIEVTIDGVRINVGWEYEISSNSVVFATDFIPAGGSTVEVFYQRMPDCEG